MSKVQEAISIAKREGIFEMVSRTSQYINNTVKSNIIKFKYKRQAARVNKNMIRTKYSEAEFLVDSWKEYQVTHDGISEQVLIDDIIEQAQESDVFYDIGAAMGTHSCLIAPHVGKTIAFEPYPPNARKTEKNVQINDVDVDVFECALSNKPGTVTMNVHRETVGPAAHSIVGDPSKHNDTIEVTAERGDYVIGDNIPAPNILKIDAEGAEAEVLRGFESALSSADCRLVYIEVHESALVNDIRSILEENEFEVEIIDTRGSTEFLRAVSRPHRHS